MVGMPLKYQHLRTKLRIEQSRMLLWGEKIGLVEERLDRPSRMLSMNRNLILDILVEIQACFSSAVKVTAQYDRLLPPEQYLAGASNQFVLSSFPSAQKSRPAKEWYGPTAVGSGQAGEIRRVGREADGIQ